MADVATLGIKVKMDGVAQASTGLDGLSASAGRAEKSAAGLSGAFGILKGIALGAIGAFSVGAIANIADQWSDLSSRVNLASTSMEDGAAVMQRLQKIANDTYSSLELTTEGYIENASTLRALGKTTQNTLDYTAALNNAMVISGAKGQRAASVQNALSKAMALGKLSGDQLNTVIANGGAVTKALADELGVSVLALRKMGAEGKITGEVIYNAVTKRMEYFAEKAAEMPATIGDAFQRIRNNVLSTVGAFDSASGASSVLAEALLSVANHVDRIIVTVGTAVTAFGVYYVGAMAAAALATGSLTGALTALRAALMRTGIGAIIVIAGELAYQLIEARRASESWAEAFVKVGERLKVIWTGLRYSWYYLVDFMKSQWFDFLSTAVSGASMAVNKIGAIFGKSFPGMEEIAQGFRDSSEDFDISSRTYADAAKSSFKDAFADYDKSPLKDLSKDAGSAASGMGDVSKAARKTSDAYADLLRSAQQRVQQMEQEATLVGMNSIAAEVLRMKLDMLQQAQEKGLKLSQSQKDALNAQADAYGNAAKKVAELTLMEDARFARAQVGRSAFEQRMASDLKGAGIEMESVAGRAYVAYAKTTEMISFAKDEAKSFASGFITDILNGKSAIESLAGALKKLGDKLIDMALDEAINGLFKNLIGILGGGGGGLLGGLFGGGSNYFPAAPSGGGIGLFANGGVTNKAAIFGEAGPEAAVPLPDGRTIPVTLNGGTGSGGDKGNVNSGNVYNFSGTSQEFQDFKNFVMERDRQFNARAQNAVRVGSKKNVGF